MWYSLATAHKKILWKMEGNYKASAKERLDMFSRQSHIKQVNSAGTFITYSNTIINTWLLMAGANQQVIKLFY